LIRLESYVLGRWQAGSGPAATLVNPATEAAVAETSTAGIDFRAVLDYGRRTGGPALRALTFAERGDLLQRMSKVLYEDRDALIEASILNGGTTRSDAKFDIDGATGTLAYYAGLGRKLGAVRFLTDGEGEQLTRSPRFWGYHIQTPRRGVAVHVNAFNFPAWGLAEKAAVALLAASPSSPSRPPRRRCSRTGSCSGSWPPPIFRKARCSSCAAIPVTCWPISSRRTSWPSPAAGTRPPSCERSSRSSRARCASTSRPTA
jgi:acyl-CoA reductase-like NAD-dependent aldehyde dehydrogenase